MHAKWRHRGHSDAYRCHSAARTCDITADISVHDDSQERVPDLRPALYERFCRKMPQGCRSADCLQSCAMLHW